MTLGEVPTVSVIVSGLALVACGDSMKEPPQMIDADGEKFLACGTDSVYITNESAWFGGETTFRVKYSDFNGLSHVIKGIRKLHVAQLPKGTKACESSTP